MYSLIDSGNQFKFEQFGDYRLVRPCAQAVWKPFLDVKEWDAADTLFTREPANQWKPSGERLPPSWIVEHGGIKFKIAPTGFGHVGMFPEHAMLWNWMSGKIKKGMKVLNLFAYTGGATLAAAKAGAEVCHVDASKTTVTWARENAALNKLEKAPIRWIVDDVVKFLKREVRRGVAYDGIILDPPTFGRGTKGEVFKIENDLPSILEECRRLLSRDPLFLIFSSHTPGYSPLVMHHVLKQSTEGLNGKVESGEMIIPGPLDLPSGTYSRWYA